VPCREQGLKDGSHVSALMEKDVLQVLVEDHAMLGWLGERLRGARPGRARSVIFNELARLLGAHQTVVDLTVFPALKACGWNGVSSDVLRSHMAMKRLLAEAIAVEREPADFDAAVRRLAPKVKVHCGLEQQHLVPVLHRLLDDDQRMHMAADAEQHLTRLLGETRRVIDDSDLEPAAEDLLEEAYVVLGSLPLQDAGPQVRH
jgi:hypothetical protein